jgi:preprotein translocase subunit SecF
MRKHRTYYLWHKLAGVSLWVIVAIFVTSVALSIFALRQNNLTMVGLRNEVYAADKQGGDVEGALRELRVFVYGHMNTNLRAGSTSSEAPIQLTYTYNRLVAAEQARVAALGGNAIVYSAAQKSCVDKTEESEKLQCIQQYLTDNGGNKFQLALPSKEFYTFDFVSPAWSPDLAGFSLLIAFASGLLLILRLIAGRFMKSYLD